MLSEEVISEFKTNIHFKEICLGLLSRFYPWDIEQVKEFKDIIDYDYMMFMNNEKINWSIELVELIEEKMDWEGLKKTKGLELNLDFFVYTLFGVVPIERLFCCLKFEALVPIINYIWEEVYSEPIEMKSKKTQMVLHRNP